MTTPPKERFLDLVCKSHSLYTVLLGAEVTLLVLSLFSLRYVEKGTQSYRVLQADLVILFLGLLGVLSLIAVCKRQS